MTENIGAFQEKDKNFAVATDENRHKKCSQDIHTYKCNVRMKYEIMKSGRSCTASEVTENDLKTMLVESAAL